MLCITTFLYRRANFIIPFNYNCIIIIIIIIFVFESLDFWILLLNQTEAEKKKE